MTTSLFGVGASFNVNVNGSLIPQSFVASAGQVLFTITNFSYAVGTNSLLVWINGQKQAPPRDFTETSTISFTLLEGCIAGDFVDIIGFPQVTLTASNATATLFTNVGIGAVPSTSYNKLVSIRKNPLEYGAVGNGINDDTVAFTRMTAAGLSYDLLDSSYTWIISSAIILSTGSNFISAGATVKQITNNTEIFNIIGRSNVSFRGISFVGVGTDFTDSDSSRAVAIYGGVAGSNIRVTFCTFLNFSYTTLRCAGQSYIWFTDNIVTGPGTPILTAIISGRCYGILFDTGCQYGNISNNTITKTAQGVRIEQSNDWTVTNNIIFNITGQHGLYIGANCSNWTIGNNDINLTSLIGIKVQAGAGFADIIGGTICGNNINNAGDQGILLGNGTGSTNQPEKVRNVSVTGNVIRNSGGTALNIQNVIGGVISGNICDTPAFSGFNTSACDNLLVELNIFKNAGLSGMRDQSPSTNVILRNNNIVNCASAAMVGDRFGILASICTSWTLDGNIITDTNAKMEYGIFLLGGIQSTVTLIKNIVTAATGNGARFVAAGTAFLLYRDNYWTGTGQPTSNEPTIPTVVSAAALTLPQGIDIVIISGTVNITSIGFSGHSGRTVTLLFPSILTVVDGSNLNLAGNFVTTSNDTITLICDGTSWNEIARSVN